MYHYLVFSLEFQSSWCIISLLLFFLFFFSSLYILSGKWDKVYVLPVSANVNFLFCFLFLIWDSLFKIAAAYLKCFCFKLWPFFHAFFFSFLFYSSSCVLLPLITQRDRYYLPMSSPPTMIWPFSLIWPLLNSTVSLKSSKLSLKKVFVIYANDSSLFHSLNVNQDTTKITLNTRDIKIKFAFLSTEGLKTESK
jgi:hypothetical protein